MRFLFKVLLFAVLQAVLFVSPGYPGVIHVDHNNTDISLIPDSWIEAVKQKTKIYYGHTSHGKQVARGLELVEKGFGRKFGVALSDRGVPAVDGALSVWDREDTYNPDDFLETVDSAINKAPEINVVMYGWCSQPNGKNWRDLLDRYIDRMNELERRYPKITFVYMTAHAQRKNCEGCNRQRFNEALREYCGKNAKVLFDFGDLDAWNAGTMNSYNSPPSCECAGRTIPLEHGRFGGGRGDGPFGHTNPESCVAKGRAMWWLLAQVAGWDPPTNGTGGAPSPALRGD